MYNPSDVGKKGSLFGLPHSEEEADLIIVPLELDVTVSYREGTSNAPKRILDESTQLDLSIPGVKKPWLLKMALAESLQLADQNAAFRTKAKQVIASLENEDQVDEQQLSAVNQYCTALHKEVEDTMQELLDRGKLVGMVGGDHSSPLGLIRALGRKDDFGILQIDAHMDLRNSYEGFQFSHASIMHNALKCDGVTSLTQVGIRDFCEEEEQYIEKSKKPIHVFFDELLYHDRLHENRTWKHQADSIVETLPDLVYISFDIDGLSPSLCPNTGTPVPGGLNFNEAIALLKSVVDSGRRIIGFDLSEVGDESWDANVGARVLYRLCVLAGISNGLLTR